MSNIFLLKQIGKVHNAQEVQRLEPISTIGPDINIYTNLDNDSARLMMKHAISLYIKKNPHNGNGIKMYNSDAPARFMSAYITEAKYGYIQFEYYNVMTSNPTTFVEFKDKNIPSQKKPKPVRSVKEFLEKMDRYIQLISEGPIEEKSPPIVNKSEPIVNKFAPIEEGPAPIVNFCTVM
jgi:hypothetical protein